MSATTIIRETENDQGEEIALIFPANFEVCGRCRGVGSHVNPSVDGNGLSREDFEQDPGFMEDYFAGVYDVECYTCKGARVVPVIDRGACTPAQLAQLDKLERVAAELARDYASERFLRMAEGGEV